MARFDTGGEPGWVETTAEPLFSILSFPVLPLLDRLPGLRFPGLWGYVPLMANSTLWAVVVLALFQARRRMPTAPKGKGA